MQATAAPLDTLRHAETPEGVPLHLRPAGAPARSLAWAVDFILRLVLFSVLAGVLSQLRGFGFGVIAIIGFMLEWFYPVLFELLPGAATPGKRLMGLKVVMSDGLPLTPSASVLRNLLRAVDFLPFFYLLGGLSMLMRSDFRRLGDLVARTMVVHLPPEVRPWALPAGPARPPAQPLTLAQQHAVLALAQRHTALTAARFEEMSQPLLAWLPELEAPSPAPARSAAASDDGATPRLLALARHLLGQMDRPEGSAP